MKKAEISKHQGPNPSLPISPMSCAQAQAGMLRGKDTGIAALNPCFKPAQVAVAGSSHHLWHCATLASPPWAGLAWRERGQGWIRADPKAPGREDSSFHPPPVPQGGTETSGCPRCHCHSCHWAAVPVSMSTVGNTPRNAEISSSVVHKHQNIILRASKPIPTTNPTDKQS